MITSESPPSKRIKLDRSPSPSLKEENPKDDDDLEREHCTICLEPFLDRTIIPVCAHEFCFECIFLWSEQSRKCPLCTRSFDNSYLIHHIRSQHDYQKYHLPPSRSSPSLPLTAESRANALRNARRERQWGRRQRQQREEADQLERAIARRRWIYQHHLYAKHVASNPYTRYRPFPTPAQFATSPDLISRMTMFLRRELHVWPNMDVEFLTTYTISLMKSIDIRSESAVKLLSEFLDFGSPYTAGERHLNAEHFAHEIYSYLRSPYRDLNIYDKTAQYDTPLEIPPPQEMERGRRWSTEPTPFHRSRSQSNSRHQSPVPHRENYAIHASAARHDRDCSAEARREDRPSERVRNRSPWSTPPPEREDDDPRNHPSGRRHGPPNGIQDILRNGHSHPVGMSYATASSSLALAENTDNNLHAQRGLRGDENGQSHSTKDVRQFIPATAAQKVNADEGGDSAATVAPGVASVTQVIDGPLEETGDNYVGEVRDGSSANPHRSRKRSAGLSVHVHPRNRTLSESVQAYLSRPGTRKQPSKRSSVSENKQLTGASATGTTSKFTGAPGLLRPTDGPISPDTGKLLSPRKISLGKTVNGGPSMSTTLGQQFPRDSCFSTVTKHADSITERGLVTRPRLPSNTGEVSEASSDVNLGRSGDPPVPGLAPSTGTLGSANNMALSHASALEYSPVDGRLESVQTQRNESHSRGPCDDQPADNAGVLDLCSDSVERWASSSGAVSPGSGSVDGRGHSYVRGRTGKDADADVPAAAPSFFHGDEGAGGRLGDDAAIAREEATCASVSMETGTTGSLPTDTDASTLETRLRARARLRVRLAAMRGTGVGGSVGSAPASGGGDGPHGVRDSGGAAEGDAGAGKVGSHLDRDQGKREVGSRGVSMLRERTGQGTSGLV